MAVLLPGPLSSPDANGCWRARCASTQTTSSIAGIAQSSRTAPTPLTLASAWPV